MNITTYKNEAKVDVATQNLEKEVKLVRNAAIARQILKIGGEDVRIVDIKQDKGDPDHKRSIFAFKNTPRFQEIFGEVLENNKRESRSEANVKLQEEMEMLRRQYDDLKKMIETKE